MNHDLQSVIDNMSMMVSYWDKNLHNQLSNLSCSSWFGLSQTQIKGMFIRDVIGDTAYEFILPYIEGALRGESQKFEWVIPSLDGSKLRHSLTEFKPDVVDGEFLGFYAYASDSSDIKNALLALQANEEKFHLIADNTSDGIVVIGADNRIDYSSPAYAKQLGYDEVEEIAREPDELYAIIHPEDRDALFADIYKAIELKQSELTYSYRVKHRAGHYIWREDHAKFIYDNLGHYDGAYVICRDITERKKNDENLHIHAAIFESHQGVLITDVQGVILRVNQAIVEDTGYTADELIGKTPRIFKSGQHGADFYDVMWESIRQSGAWQGEMWGKRKNGEIYPKWMTISAIKNMTGVISYYVATYVDIVEHRKSAHTIENLAFYDPLTHLANRRLLLDRLQQTLATAIYRKRNGALLFIDLDNFKTLNDTRGHSVGDSLLKQVAARLNASVRKIDTVARLGGDEFVVILEDLNEQEVIAATEAEQIGETILYQLGLPYQLENYISRHTASIGATLLTDRTQSTEELLKQADIAMYQAKKDGRNKLRFFDQMMQDKITQRANLENQLFHAIENNELQLKYQIQVDQHGRAFGAEVLICWINSQYGEMPPTEFIPLAEESGLILPIGNWVLNAACAQLRNWQNNPHARSLVLAVNVSALQLHQTDFVSTIQKIIQDHKIDPRLLKIELTESILISNIEETIAKMNELKHIGVQFSLDDFGTGYSSLQYLKRLPFNQMKIDKSFVQSIELAGNDRTIVRTIIVMAHSMNIDLIAEGVETEIQKNLLISKGCTKFQGFLFGKPMPIAQFESVLESYMDAHSCQAFSR